MSIMNQQATLGGGCFWCLEAVYQHVKGVHRVESGYAGGKASDANYDAVCSGRTDHAEVVRLEFDSSVISFKQLLEIFYAIHDPTTLNRQGNDVGSQYRSVIFTHDESQKTAAMELVKQLDESGIFGNKIVTEISDLPNYYPAEEYHQNYFNLHPDQGYCAFVVSPKVSKFRDQFKDLLM
ncbi:peptide-methionine (S)-S-oxide reductase MsrA [Polynucleobacter cosmopolitanus]|jgi:peptide-methionine (S)-S-oxide reductase|uniref:Peptide methionine sulfoxide reductase MsrA n=1 Tax=Polynucleobacter cosmopolitanus TaxID=351345 RepID=A0A229FWM1_9BURK|nr:peptide-methionine (S)-S-oxide reductase MsrA [Polynucleobacter cosmopolitanus]OXL16344.1 peptide-methionine (S)-S-oxide reductase [Polynucleobacter cosmopolitanus]